MRRLRIRTRDPWYLEHLHRPIEHTVYNLEPSRLVAPHRSRMSHISRLSLCFRVFEHYVGRFKDFDW